MLQSTQQSPWVVIKFGGTSVSNLECWKNIVSIIKQRLAERLRPLIVCSAPSNISNKLEELLKQAAQDDYEEVLLTIENTYRQLAQALQVNFAEHCQY